MDVDSLKNKFLQRIASEMKDEDDSATTSQDYKDFRDAYIPSHQSYFEQACNFCDKNIKVKPDKKTEQKLAQDIQTAHLEITPAGVFSFALFGPLAFIMIFSSVSLLLTGSLFLVFFFLILGGLGIMLIMKLPEYFANSWRMKGSNQMIIAVFYIVTYMRHTSNLERAIEFAAHHLQPPMSLDLKKILWNVESEKYNNVIDSMEAYLQQWRGFNDEFIESMHLIQSSLYEDSEQKRVETLDKSLDVILSQTYEKMLHYAHNLQSPITTLHMFGIILPILGLVILPLMISFMEGVQWYHIASIYNVALPIVVYVMGKNILQKRPTGYGATDILEPDEQKRNIFSPLSLAAIVFVVLFFIGMSPIWLYWIGLTDFGFGDEVSSEVSSCGRTHCFLDYHAITNPNSPNIGDIAGPFGLGAAVMSLLIPAAFCCAIGLYYRMKSKNVLAIRERTKKLEKEFSHAIFSLGNRLGDGIPAEMAFEKVGESMPNTNSGNFFMLAAYNIQKLGMSIQEALFDKKYGAITSYPSSLIESSMKVLVQSSKKGPKIASQALLNISRYLDEVHRVNERLKDLMGEVISSMKSQINFLTPIIAGIVIGITSMISTILSRLSGTIGQLSDSNAAGTGVPGGGGLLNMFGDGLPTFYFQVIVGIYVVQIVYILTVLVNGIENGVDPVNKRWLLGQNMIKSVGLYLGISLAVMLLFNIIAGAILGSLN